MKYVLLFCGTRDDQRRFEAGMTEAERGQAYARVGAWFHEHGPRILSSEQLQAPSAATTVRFDNGRPIVTDGPYIEGNEIIGGYALVEAEDLDHVLKMASGWPAGPVEVRPVVER